MDTLKLVEIPLILVGGANRESQAYGREDTGGGKAFPSPNSGFYKYMPTSYLYTSFGQGISASGPPQARPFTPANRPVSATLPSPSPPPPHPSPFRSVVPPISTTLAPRAGPGAGAGVGVGNEPGGNVEAFGGTGPGRHLLPGSAYPLMGSYGPDEQQQRAAFAYAAVDPEFAFGFPANAYAQVDMGFMVPGSQPSYAFVNPPYLAGLAALPPDAYGPFAYYPPPPGMPTRPGVPYEPRQPPRDTI
jgi:hypothetical protein